MARYKLTKDGVKNNATGAFIPKDPLNRHWREYLRWVASGNIPDAEYTREDAYIKKLNDIARMSKRKREGAFSYSDGKSYPLGKINKVLKDKLADKTKTFIVLAADGSTTSFVKKEYDKFCNALIDAIDSIEDAEMMHTNAVIDLYNDPAKSADDILNYDSSTGW